MDIIYAFSLSFSPHDEVAFNLIAWPVSFIEPTCIETGSGIASMLARNKAHCGTSLVDVTAPVRPLEENGAPFSETGIGKRLCQEIVPCIVVLIVPFVVCGWE